MLSRETAFFREDTDTKAFNLLTDQEGLDSYVDYLWAGIVVGVIALSFMVADPRMSHWFIIPAVICGTLTAPDVWRWLRGSMDLFDMKGWAGIWLFYGWFLAPLLHVFLGYYGPELEFTGDQRHWLGVAASLNALGIIGYKMSQRWFFHHTAPVHTYREILPPRLLPVLAGAAAIGFCAQTVFYLKFRNVFQENIAEKIQAMQGTGWLLILGDSLPVLLCLGFILWTNLGTRSSRRSRSSAYIAIFLTMAAVTQFVWAGLRGSRSAFVFAMLWIVGLVHYYWRPFRPRHLLLGLVPFLAFMYFYGFYKEKGFEATKALSSHQARTQLERETGRTLPTMLLGDLARADVSACVANGVIMERNGYEWRWGRTYVQAVSKLIPSQIWRSILGDSSFQEAWSAAHAFQELNEGRTGKDDYQRSTRVFGLSGEALLNFGPLGVPPAWFLFGALMGWFRRKMYTLKEGDARWALIPFFSVTLSRIPNTHFEVMLFGIIKSSLIIFICVYLWSRRTEIKMTE